MPERLFTAHQVADLLGATPAQVHHWIRSGWLPCHQLPDGPIRISERGLIEFLRGQGVDLEKLLAETLLREGRAAGAAAGVPAAASPPPPPPPMHLALPAGEPPPAAVAGAAAEFRPEPVEPGGTLPEAAAPAGAGAGIPGPDRPTMADIAADARPSTGSGRAELVDARDAAAAAAASAAPAGVAGDGVAGALTGRSRATVAGVADGWPRAADSRGPGPPGLAEDFGPLPPGEGPPPDAAAQVAGAILSDAVARGASHIHLEPRPEGPRLRLRIDGQLRDKPSFTSRLPEGLAPRIVDRLLADAGLASADAARPLAGRFLRTVDGRRVEFRLSACPTTRGPRLTLAVNDLSAAPPSLADLMRSDRWRQQLERVLSGPGGLILAAGVPLAIVRPALRTLAAWLAEVGRDILAIDPHDDLEVAGACRMRPDPARGLTFAAAAGAALDQDADVVLIGRMGDPVTAAAAVEAALAGATVLAGVEAATAADALGALAEMGLEPWPLASALKGIIAHRAIRRLCQECKRPAGAPPEVLARVSDEGGLGAALRRGATLYAPVGCPRCDRTGFCGTLLLRTLLIPDATLTDLVRRGSGSAAIRAAAAEAGPAAFRRLAHEKLLAGETSLDEAGP